MPSQMTREIMKDYEKDRAKAWRLRSSRQGELWAEVPRLREIDEKLSSMGLMVTRSILEGGDAASLTEELARESEALQAEKAALLEKSGYGASYAEDVFICNACGDTGFAGGEKCACFKRRLSDKFHKYSNLSNILKRENFDTFDMGMYSNAPDPKSGVSPRGLMNTHWKRALEFVESFDDKFANFLFYGETGLGKTFLCNCIAKELIDNGRSVIYVTSPKLFKLVEKVRFDRAEDDDETDEFLQALLDSDLLIIDDLGAETSTSVTLAELFNILNSRLMSRRPTIISTNYSLTEITERYSDRITSRILGNFTAMRFAGEDIRIKMQYKGLEPV